ncbi:MAG TPA: DUF4129 domain-containing protein [Symbiobacteriaceae bacterium]|jgi:hypothetical protein
MQPFLRNWKQAFPWVLAALAETAVAIPWLVVLYSAAGGQRWPDALPGAWLLLATYLGAAVWESGTPRKAVGEATPKSRLVALLVGVVVTYGLAYAALPSDLRHGLLQPGLALAYVPMACYLWYQGTLMSADGLAYNVVFVHFLWQCGGLVAGLAGLVLMGYAADPRIYLLLFWSVPLLFASGLLLLVVSREANLRQSQKRIGQEGGHSPVTSPVLTFVVAGLVGLTILVSQVLSVDRLRAWGRAVWHLLDGPLTWLYNVFELILYRWVMLLWLVIGPAFNWLRARALRTQPQGPQEPVQSTDPLEEFRKATGDKFDLALPYLRAALLAAVVILAAALLMRRLKVLREKERDEEEERISLGFWSNLLADQKALFGLLRRHPGAADGVADGGERFNPKDPRALFRRLQSYGERAGRPRSAAETPNTYRDRLAALRAEAEPAATAVTEVYNQARYGATPPAPAAVDQAATALAVLPKAADPAQTRRDR